MKLNICISDKMSEKNSPLGNIENKLIRIPEKLRKQINVKIGSFLYLKTKTGQTTPLQISRAYFDDVYDENYAYVSSDTYHLLQTETKQKIELVEDVLLGCDPEFFIVDDDGQNISAGNFFPMHGEVGNDCGLGELRPKPDKHPYGLLLNVRNLLDNANNELNNRTLFKSKNIRMIATSAYNKLTAGFHIHFGLPQKLLMENEVIVEALRYRIVTVLDYYIGILSILPEGEEDSARRAYMSGQYGKPGDFRYNYLTFEYRVPGGHLLRHPLLTVGLFAISKLVMGDVLSRVKIATENYTDIKLLKDYKSVKLLYPRLPDRSDVYEAIISAKTDKAFKYINNIATDLSDMVEYAEVDTFITEYLNYVITHSKKQKFSKDIVENWGLNNERQPKQMEFY